jgi:hypothetical protein
MKYVLCLRREATVEICALPSPRSYRPRQKQTRQTRFPARSTAAWPQAIASSFLTSCCKPLKADCQLLISVMR